MPIFKSKHIFITCFILGTAGLFCFSTIKALDITAQPATRIKAIQPQEIKKLITIEKGATYGVLMEQAGVGDTASANIYNAAFDLYDFVKLRAGRNLELYFPENSTELKRLVYKIDSEEEIIVMNQKTATTSQWIAEIKPINYQVKVVAKSGSVQTSMYEAAFENNIDKRAIIELANAFQWTIDFAMDPRVGDTFKFVYEERYLDGEYIMPGKVLAGEYVNDGKKYQVYYFQESEENSGYFDEQGNSAQKMFLKAPLSFKYISSGFTNGRRYVKAFNVFTGHRAIDYAAKYGTPVRSVGNGTVIFAAYNGPYGYTIKVHHNGTYTTQYSHLSRFAVKYGAKVKQGDVIGYVGSTGFSTGPHLHYEMVKNGVKVNPLREILPPGKPIKERYRNRFFSEIKKWQTILSQ